MTDEMRKLLARLPYEEKLRRVAALNRFSREFKAAKSNALRDNEPKEDLARKIDDSKSETWMTFAEMEKRYAE